jgi:hypothetical protein
MEGITYIGFHARISNRVARWFIFKQKNPIWVTFGGPYIGKMDLLYGHLK